jgi:hypothetical protein
MTANTNNKPAVPTVSGPEPREQAQQREGQQVKTARFQLMQLEERIAPISRVYQ